MHKFATNVIQEINNHWSTSLYTTKNNKILKSIKFFSVLLRLCLVQGMLSKMVGKMHFMFDWDANYHYILHLNHT